MPESKAFILKNTVYDNQAKVLGLHDLMCRLYAAWGVGIEPDVEVSVKIGQGKTSYNRYAIPVVGTPGVTFNMIKEVLEGLGAPPHLQDVIKESHSRRVRMIAGCDYDSGGKRVYFHEGDQACGYEFRDASGFIAKRYSLVPKNDFREVSRHLEKIGLHDSFIKTLLLAMPLESWSQVCARENPLVNEDGIIGYHLSASPKGRIGQCGGHLKVLAHTVNPKLDESGFDKWLEKNEDSFLSWLGIAADKSGQAEITFYIRPDAREWDERYRPKDFISFFGIEIMNM